MPLITTKPFKEPSGAFFNGTTSVLERNNDTIITSGKSDGFVSLWIQLPPSGDHFAVNASDTSNRAISNNIGYVAGAGDDVVRHWWYEFGKVNKIFDISLGTNIANKLKSRMVHFVVNKPGDTLGREVWVDGTLLGTMTRVANDVTIDTDPLPDKLRLGFFNIPQTGSVYYRGYLKNAVYSSTLADNTIASNLFNIGIDGDASTVGGFTMTAWYPLKTDFNDYSGNGKHFTTTTDVTLI